MKIPSSSSILLATLAVSSSAGSLGALAAPTGESQHGGMTPSSSFHTAHTRHMSLNSARAVPPDELEQRAELMARGPLLAGLLGPLGLAGPVCGLLRKLPLPPITDALCGKEGTAGAASVEDYDDGSYDAESDDRLDELRAAVASVSNMMSAAGIPSMPSQLPSPPVQPPVPSQLPPVPVSPSNLPPAPVNPSNLPVTPPAPPVSPSSLPVKPPVNPSDAPVQPPVPIPVAAASDGSASDQPPSKRAREADEHLDAPGKADDEGNSRAPPNTPVPSHSVPMHHPAESVAPSKPAKAPVGSATAEHGKGAHTKSSDGSSARPEETAAPDAQ
ncbi:hypothetical protein EV122DRAFT_267225 [Schizophyllum commune]